MIPGEQRNNDENPFPFREISADTLEELGYSLKEYNNLPPIQQLFLNVNVNINHLIDDKNIPNKVKQALQEGLDIYNQDNDYE